MLDLLITHATLPDGRQNMSIAVQGGRITEVTEGLQAPAHEAVDAGGLLVSPPFVDAHFHMDSTLSYGQPRVNDKSPTIDNDVQDSLLVVSTSATDVETLRLLSISISGVACSVSLVMHKLIAHTVILPFFVPSQSAITCILIVTFTHGFGRSISVAPFDHRVPPTTTGAPPRLHDAPMRTVGVAKVHPTVPCNDVVLGDKRAELLLLAWPLGAGSLCRRCHMRFPQ